ncbi:hypothetical protein D5018_11725 [Parashewanella curva]|uniref:Uncharacterized protein n=1 Tax=Parashewanella curva TaxID=2338552 RepID=A0A3L8PZL3_9GAMM|nr:hypothetical protein [Parashewanella curva]RLV59532.1 hypothetical protein D5018_11725 [Parashewanella curva]
MKSLILLVALSTPAFAAKPVTVFGDWLVFQKGKEVITTSIPRNLSNRIFVIGIHADGTRYVSYTYPSRENCQNTNWDNRYVNVRGYNSRTSAIAGFLFYCSKTKQWELTGPAYVSTLLNFLNQGFPVIDVNFPDSKKTTNTYSLYGLEDALNYMFNKQNNFNQK